MFESLDQPVAVPTRHTLRFVLDHLPPPPVRVLEVGCGTGDLALALLREGYEVLAVDSSGEAVETARRRGVPARTAEWPSFTDAPFAALLFTRSLHHVHDLEASLDRARELLEEDGALLVEDFAFESLDGWSARWLQAQLRLLAAAGVVSTDGEEFGHALLKTDDAEGTWHADHHHDHELHGAPAMEAAIRARFDLVHAEPAAYLYRYALALLPASPRAAAVLEELLQLETQLGEIREASLIGRRYVARPARA